MNKQEIFDKAYLGLKAQGFVQSMGEEDSCAYRNPDGLKCAVGHLIPDELYNPAWDTIVMGVTELPEEIFEYLQIDRTDPYMLEFLQELQNTHDYYSTEMEDALKQFAKSFVLTVPE